MYLFMWCIGWWYFLPENMVDYRPGWGKPIAKCMQPGIRLSAYGHGWKSQYKSAHIWQLKKVTTVRSVQAPACMTRQNVKDVAGWLRKSRWESIISTFSGYHAHLYPVGSEYRKVAIWHKPYTAATHLSTSMREEEPMILGQPMLWLSYMRRATVQKVTGTMLVSIRNKKHYQKNRRDGWNECSAPFSSSWTKWLETQYTKKLNWTRQQM